jgi:hypothetical protein
MTGERPASAVLLSETDPLPIVQEGVGPSDLLEEVKNLAPNGSDPRSVSTEDMRIIALSHN